MNGHLTYKDQLLHNELNDGYHIIYLNFDHNINLYSTEYYNVHMSRDVVVNPDGVSPSVVLLITLNIKVF